MQRLIGFGWLALGALLVLAAPACAKEQLLVAGTGDGQELLRELGRAFEAANPDVQVIIPASIGSSGGVRTLIYGDCDLARVARPLKASELAQAPDLRRQVFALSPVVFVANLPERCLDSLSSEQLIGVFAGEIGDWSELGSCPDHKIYVALREEGDSSRTVIERKIPAIAAIAKPAGMVVYSTPETVQVLAETPYTIGYLPQASIPNHSLQILAFDGKAPTPENVRTGHYPLVTPLGLVWKGEMSDPARRFVDFVSGPTAASIIQAAGSVPTAN